MIKLSDKMLKSFPLSLGIRHYHHLKVAEGINLRYSHDMMEVLANAMVVIIVQYIDVLNQHIVPPKLIQCHMSFISQ